MSQPLEDTSERRFPFPQVELMGTSFSNAYESEVIARIINEMKEGHGGWVVTPNVDMLRLANKSKEMRGLIADADIVTADGLPLLWASRVLGFPLHERVTGADLIINLSAAAGQADIPVFLLGAGKGVAQMAALKLHEQFLNLQVGHHYPPFGFEDQPSEMAAIREQLASYGASIVFCGLGAPKQERLIYELHRELPDYWFVGCGAGIDFIAGQFSRAPKWMQHGGLEWLHRLALEPRRLFRRYLVEDLPFFLNMMLTSALTRNKERGFRVRALRVRNLRKGRRKRTDLRASWRSLVHRIHR